MKVPNLAQATELIDADFGEIVHFCSVMLINEPCLWKPAIIASGDANQGFLGDH